MHLSSEVQNFSFGCPIPGWIGAIWLGDKMRCWPEKGNYFTGPRLHKECHCGFWVGDRGWQSGGTIFVPLAP